MSRTYLATGINLKAMALGESDRLVTIFTQEYGLIRAVAPGARKYQSSLRGRTELFVVNQLLLVKGRSLDKITQAETLETYPGLSNQLGKLAASQYLAELVLALAPHQQSQPEFYHLLLEHLRRLEQLPKTAPFLPLLVQAVFHLLAIAGFAPVVNRCCLSQQQLSDPLPEPLGFSFEAGGLIIAHPNHSVKIDHRLEATELMLLQKLAAGELPSTTANLDQVWIRLERLLRDYAQYHCGCYLRSAFFLDEQYASFST